VVGNAQGAVADDHRDAATPGRGQVGPHLGGQGGKRSTDTTSPASYE
jgi:hypothetical protein